MHNALARFDVGHYEDTITCMTSPECLMQIICFALLINKLKFPVNLSHSSVYAITNVSERLMHIVCIAWLIDR